MKKITTKIAVKSMVLSMFFSLFLAALFFVVNLIFFDLEDKNEVKRVNNAINIGTSLARHDIKTITSYLNFLTLSDSVKSYANIQSKENREHVEYEFLNLLKTNRFFDQVRFIDEFGMEKVRVDYFNNNPKIISRDQLQNKKSRYYFAETAKIQDNKLFISPLDLNRENGKVEIPYKPVIRFARTVRDENNEFKGILIVNYLAGHLLKDVYKHFSLEQGKVSLLNEDGYWLISSNKDNEWGFTLDHKKRFSDQFPNVWNKIKEGPKQGSFKNANNSYYFFAVDSLLNINSMIPNENVALKNWILVLNKGEWHSWQSMFFKRDNSLFVFIFFFGIFFIFIWTKVASEREYAEASLKELNVTLEAMVIDRTRDLTQRAKELEATKSAVIVGMASLAEMRDSETGQHLKRTQEYVRILATELKATPDFENVITDELITIYTNTAPLHDIGKVGVSDAILLKKGALSVDEFTEMKKHAMLGEEIVDASIRHLQSEFPSKQGLRFLTIARELVGGHHEKWDGNGYPRGLVGDEIPVSARIMALADVFDALSTKRSYKEAFSVAKVKQIILEGDGTHFDPRVIKAFLNVQDKFWDIRKEFADK